MPKAEELGKPIQVNFRRAWKVDDATVDYFVAHPNESSTDSNGFVHGPPEWNPKAPKKEKCKVIGGQYPPPDGLSLAGKNLWLDWFSKFIERPSNSGSADPGVSADEASKHHHSFKDDWSGLEESKNHHIYYCRPLQLWSEEHGYAVHGGFNGGRYAIEPWEFKMDGVVPEIRLVQAPTPEPRYNFVKNDANPPIKVNGTELINSYTGTKPGKGKANSKDLKTYLGQALKDMGIEQIQKLAVVEDACEQRIIKFAVSEGHWPFKQMDFALGHKCYDPAVQTVVKDANGSFVVEWPVVVQKIQDTPDPKYSKPLTDTGGLAEVLRCGERYRQLNHQRGASDEDTGLYRSPSHHASKALPIMWEKHSAALCESSFKVLFPADNDEEAVDEMPSSDDEDVAGSGGGGGSADNSA